MFDPGFSFIKNGLTLVSLVPDSVSSSIFTCFLNEHGDLFRFSDTHEFKKPNDERGLKLMTRAARSVLQENPDITFAYGQSDEYSFIFKKSTKAFNRRSR